VKLVLSVAYQKTIYDGELAELKASIYFYLSRIYAHISPAMWTMAQLIVLGHSGLFCDHSQQPSSTEPVNPLCTIPESPLRPSW
jgi:hypothetical protein